MSLGNPDYLRNDTVFGNRLNKVGKDMGLYGAAQIAGALYDNLECFKVIKPGGRKARYEVNRVKDIYAISRAVQRHFDYDDYYNVPSNYMFAYHILFKCSLDYLYGVIDDPYPNAEVADICKKTGLSSKAVDNLMKKSEIYLEGFLYQHYQYEFLYSNIDPEGTVKVTEFWSDVLESDLFYELPEDWASMACALQLLKAMEEEKAALDARYARLPGREDFYKRVDEYYATHDGDPCMGDDPYEIYDHDPDRAAMIIREMDDEEWEEAIPDIGKAQTVYWGCTGLFDRKIGNYFHEKAEHFTIPRLDIDKLPEDDK